MPAAPSLPAGRLSQPTPKRYERLVADGWLWRRVAVWVCTGEPGFASHTADKHAQDTGSDSNPPAPTAGLSFVITGTDGQTNFDVPSTGGSYPLIVFALIQDADGQPDPLGNDGLMAAEVGASLTGTLVGSGNAYFKTNASGTPQVRYQPGASATASARRTWGSGNTIGIGASDQTTTAGPVENTLYLGTANVSVAGQWHRRLTRRRRQHVVHGRRNVRHAGGISRLHGHSHCKIHSLVFDGIARGRVGDPDRDFGVGQRKRNARCRHLVGSRRLV